MQEISRTGASIPVREIAGVCNDIDIKLGTEKLFDNFTATMDHN